MKLLNDVRLPIYEFWKLFANTRIPCKDAKMVIASPN